ncbi:MAG TPA: PaaI family thioesterase [Ilumatobacteraceae bacterium]|nr:PaaI family thioesterase [Ilumatobacteraceae bacterium]
MTTPSTPATPPTEIVHQTMPLCATLGITAREFAADAVVLDLDWRPELCTSNGVLHGGVIMTLADSAGAGCAFSNLPDGAIGTSTIESKTNFLGAVKGGSVTARSTPLHVGSTTIVVETEVRDDTGRLVAKVTQTQAVLRPRP